MLAPPCFYNLNFKYINHGPLYILVKKISVHRNRHLKPGLVRIVSLGGLETVCLKGPTSQSIRAPLGHLRGKGSGRLALPPLPHRFLPQEVQLCRLGVNSLITRRPWGQTSFSDILTFGGHLVLLSLTLPRKKLRL